MISFFKGYFARVRYLEWSDAAPPMVSLSPTARLGWMAVKIRAATSNGEARSGGKSLQKQLDRDIPAGRMRVEDDGELVSRDR
jgi:hypothetical protein